VEWGKFPYIKYGYWYDAIFDFIDYSVFFLDGLIFAVMYLTDMKKEFK